MEEENITNSELRRKSGAKRYGLAAVMFAALLCALIMLYSADPFRDAVAELGSPAPTLEDFLDSGREGRYCSLVTPITDDIMDHTGDYQVELRFLFITRKKTLSVKDTVPPVIETMDVASRPGYVPEMDQFVSSVSDASEVSLSFGEEVLERYDDYGVFDISIVARDEYGNESVAGAKLHISIFNARITVEHGEKITASQIAIDRKAEQYVPKDALSRLNKSDIGEYTVEASYKGHRFSCVVEIVDTRGPSIRLRDISRYSFEDVSGLSLDSFLIECSDPSGKADVEFLNTIDFRKLGTQTLRVKATDKYGNVSTASCTYTYKNDDVPPVFEGLGDMLVKKNSEPDYRKGVSATDNCDGPVDFTVDSSAVDITKAGVYYIQYTAVDGRGNKATAKRRVEVEHDQQDTQELFDEFFNANLSGKSVLEVVSTIKSRIRYNTDWGGSDPVWYGLKNRAGNCYVHAMLVQMAMKKMGYESILIYTTDKWHYWNLIYCDGRWAHYDSTSSHSTGPDNDETKWNARDMKGHTWDKEKFPAANW